MLVSPATKNRPEKSISIRSGAFLPVYGFTLLISAFLLFGVQPLVGKMILPQLGGAPQVWNVAMLFFQAMLLCGYAYAHLTSRLLTVRVQAILHIFLLCFCLFFLPVAIPSWWPQADSDHPLSWELKLMVYMAGIPFFVLAASAPMLQRWFAASSHRLAEQPYFLYAASNAGSLAALLAYPFLIEPALTTGQQSHYWSLGFTTLIVLTAASALLYRPGPAASASLKPRMSVPLSRKLHWLALAFLPSSLMLGVTSFITADIASVPLLWVVPLALYVTTFIVAFARKPLIGLQAAALLQGLSLLLACSVLLFNYMPNPFCTIAVHMLVFFSSALLCHLRLASLKPEADNLTGFYFMLSLGGVMGGAFNALAAPILFPVPVEYALVLALIAFVRYAGDPRYAPTAKIIGNELFNWPLIPLLCAVGGGVAAAEYALVPEDGRIAMFVAMAGLALLLRGRFTFAVGASVILLANPGLPWATLHEMLALHRNFFGVTRVENSPHKQMRLFLQGSTVHGAQALIDPFQMVPMGYYHPNGPAGDIFGVLDNHGGASQKVGALGLGVGSIACYVRPGRSFDFFEIDPAVPPIAQNSKFFTYLSDCGSSTMIVLGDGRLKIAGAPDASYDLIFLDAFASDTIPVHLLTTEAFDLYRRKLKPGGFIAADISNRYLNLAPVMDALAKVEGMTVLFKTSPTVYVTGTDIIIYASNYAAFLTDSKDAPLLLRAGWKPYSGPAQRAWTDSYASLFGIVRFGPAKLPRN